MDEFRHMVDQMRTVEHFNSLSLVDLLAIVTSGQVLNFQPGSILFCEGDPCAGMYVLLNGKIDLFRTGPEGQISLLDSLSPVIMFNEVPVLDGGSNPVSAQAFDHVRVWFIPCARFCRLIKRHPELATGLLKVLARRNRLLVNNYSDLSFRSVPARLAKQIVELSGKGMNTINRSIHSNKNLASKIVTSPEAVSRTINLFGSRNLIDISRDTIRVLDIDGLLTIAQLE